ncbi:MAG TPA: hypothetical protein VHS09_16695 [Polyangiaceae bacterium]|nr:hypothetical protein [Polyangiaceae bacterium]
MRPTSLLSLVLAPLLPACSALLPSQGIAKAQETAQSFNEDARFGRNEMVLDQIAPAAREEFSQHHRAWGKGIRVADIELAGLKKHGDKDVDIVVHVSWYTPEQQELRSTLLQQTWHNKTDSWQLMAETRMDGDIGLLGESVVVEAPTERKVPSQFPTIRLGGDPAPD